MDMNKKTLYSVTQGVTISHPFIEQHDAELRKLMIILPGQSYTFERPLLYYLTRCGAEVGYDVLNIRFAFHITHSEPDFSTLAEEVTLALEQIPDYDYSEVVIAGKSLGTLFIPHVVNHFKNISCRRILLTPVNGSTLLNDDLPTLGILGTADDVVDLNIIVEDSDKTHYRWVPYERLNHSLEDANSWTQSIEHLMLIIRDCQNFLQQT